MVRNMNRWWREYYRWFVRTSGAITITAASSYQPTVIVHHRSQFAPPVGSDHVLHITVASPYEPAVKTFSPPARCMIWRWLPCYSINKFITFSNKVTWKQTFYQSCRSRYNRQLHSWWLFHLKPFTVPNSVWSDQILKFNFFELYKQP